MSIILRQARLDERVQIEGLIAASARGLSREDYTDEQIEAAIAAVFGVDTDLIVDGTYFVAEAAEMLVGCGGWSKRKTLFGGDRYSDRESGYLDPNYDAAKIRAFSCILTGQDKASAERFYNDVKWKLKPVVFDRWN